MQELADKLVSWLRERVAEAKARGVVVGMSGGLDSSVVVVLCKAAFPDSTLGVFLPCHSNPSDIEHASMVARKFKIPTRSVELGSTFDALLGVLPGEAVDPAAKKRAEANLKPRLRMVTLYYLANQLGYLVVGCSNKSELMVGYFSKYGDGGADMLPLGNLVKEQVRKLARHLGIPREIIDKQPSAGLWEGQTDEQEMGITYEQLDRYLTTGEAGAEMRKAIEGKIAESAHKRKMPPIPPF